MLDPESCWSALVERNPAPARAFFYGVRTTGVYCRPSCASRLPLRKNVTFHPDVASAEAAGLRACKRCRPNEASPVEAQVAAVKKACAILREREPAPPLAELAREVGVSPYHFHRMFKQVVGATPREYARAERLARFAGALDAGRPIASSVFDSGFGSSSRAYESAASGLGMTPGARKRGGAGERIGYVTVRTALGVALVAATERGICATELGDDARALVASLRARFPGAELRQDEGALRDWAKQIVEFIASPDHALDLPLDVRGTAFQAQVWRALQRIPPGTTATYAEVAAALGRPKAVRAVAQACAANALALLVPCHRVVRGDGATGGYRWGAERKRALLERERKARPT
jgi:AraC family transcriptional regulator of adaptative response/methylated-DNA-[protein]-cysteine methyltransferase